jgi:hypothetical protein
LQLFTAAWLELNVVCRLMAQAGKSFNGISATQKICLLHKSARCPWPYNFPALIALPWMISDTTRSPNPAGHAGLLENLLALASTLTGFLESRFALLLRSRKQHSCSY